MAQSKGKKAKTAFVCDDCGTEHRQWQGQCTSCGAWNTLSRVNIGPIREAGASSVLGFAGTKAEVRLLGDVETADAPRLKTGFGELDRVLGGGLVPGSVVLMGGDPGAGKSTLLLQVSSRLAGRSGVLYVTGEESLHQLADRAQRLNLPVERLHVASETRAEAVAALIDELKPSVVILDSIQVMQMETVDSMPGSVSQVRETAAFFTRLAKQTGVVIVLVGHITKEGNLAGPKVLEHMIDCFLMLDAPPGSRFRTLRGQKNRFGAVNELGVFAMTGEGMKEVANPSAIFLERGETISPGSVATVTWEGYTPVTHRDSGTGRPVAVGVRQAHRRGSGSAAIRHAPRRVASPLWDHVIRSGCVRERGRGCAHYRNRCRSRLDTRRAVVL